MTTYHGHNRLETLQLPKQGKFDLLAYVVPDEDCLPSDFDCYTPKQLEAWRNEDWYFVGVYVVASINGIDLSMSSLWGIEYGEFPLTDENDNLESVTSLDLANLASRVLPYLISEVIQSAENNLEALANA